MSGFIKKWKIALIIAAAAIVAIIAIVVAVSRHGSESTNEEGVTRYEWVQMLAEKFGMTEYQSDTPYYSDVPADSPYFAAVQSAHEWGVTPDEKTFDGDRTATGEYVALTAMKAIGRYKVQIYLGIAEEPTTEQYLKLAEEKGVIDETQRKQAFTKESCESALERAEELFLYDLWVDDLAEVEYQDGIIELTEDDFVVLPEDDDILHITKEKSRELRSGVTIVYPDISGMITAGIITDIQGDGTIAVSPVEYTQVFKSMLLSDMEPITIEDFLDAYDIDPSEGKPIEESLLQTGYNPIDEKTKLLGWNKELPIYESAGFSFKVTWENSNLGVSIIDNQKELEFALPINGKIEKSEDENKNSGSIIIGVTDIAVGAQLVGSGITPDDKELDYINFQYKSALEVKGEAAFHAEYEIPFKPINKVFAKLKDKLNDGPAPFAVDIGVYIKLAADGSVELVASFPTVTSIVWERGAGVRGPIYEVNPHAELKANCSLGIYPEFKCMLEVMKHKLIDFSVEGGPCAQAEFTLRANSDIKTCIDLQVYVPLITIKLELNFVVLEIDKEWKLLTPENAPLHFGLHSEEYEDGTLTFPERCTYQKKTVSNKITVADLDDGGYLMQYTESPTLKNGCYTLTGKLYQRDGITLAAMDDMKTGDVYKQNQHEFTYLMQMTLNEFYGVQTENGDAIVHVFEDQDGNLYIPDLPYEYLYLFGDWHHFTLEIPDEFFEDLNYSGTDLAYGIVYEECSMELDEYPQGYLEGFMGNDHFFEFWVMDHRLILLTAPNESYDYSNELAHVWTPGHHFEHEEWITEAP